MATPAAIRLGSQADFLLRLRCQPQPELLEGAAAGFVGYQLDGEAADDGAFVRWSMQEGQFALSTDRLGLYPLYYLQQGNELVISNSVALIQQQCTLEPHTEAVAIFLRLGFYLGSDTAFKGLIRPEGKLEVRLDDNGLCLQVSRPERRQLAPYSPQRYQQLFAAALTRLTDCQQPLYIPLTGGKDSRHILLTAAQQGLPVQQCYTTRVLSPHCNDDVSIASTLCQRLNIPHRVLLSEQRLVNAEQQKNIRTNYETYDHFWINQVGQYMQQQAPGLILDGFGGDVLSQSKIVTAQMHECYQNRDWARLYRLIAPSDPYYNAHFGARPELLLLPERLEARLQAELLKFADDVIPIKSFYFWNRSRRAIAISSFRQLNGNSQPFFPYMQAGVFDFLLSLPPAEYFSQDFHARCIGLAFPDFAAMPYASRHSRGDALASKRKFYNLLALIGEIAQADFMAVPMRLRAMMSCLAANTSKESAVTFFYFFRPMIYLNQLNRLRMLPRRRILPQTSA